MSGRLLRAGLVYAGANVLAAAVPFLLLPILTRALAPDQYGQVVSFSILVPVCSALAGLGLQSAVGVRWLDRASGDPRRYTATAVVLTFGSTAGAGVLAMLLAPLAGVALAPWLCFLAAVSAGAATLQAIRFAVWQSLDRPLPAAGLQVTGALLNMALSLLAVLWLDGGGVGRIVGATIAVTVVALASVASLHRTASLGRPNRGDALALLRFGAPLVPHTLAGAVLASADRFAVAGQLGSAPLGVYGAAAQLGMLVNVVTDAAMKALSPTFYRMLAGRTLRQRLRLVAVTYLSVPAWMLLAALMWGALLLGGPWLLGPQYVDALDLAPWFLFGGAISGVYLAVSTLFFFTGRTEWLGAATVATAGLAMLIAPLCVARLGVHGGGLAYCAAQAVFLALAWQLSRRVSPMPWASPRLALRLLWRRRRAAAPT
jgi:O-antigen/teichoic acid export membrane protein